ncbi:hypothetical protein N665_2463s0002 [Sinapis alba]|nr:hypothetical protein N665_2463s0002 [Sinapis alba]
MYVVDAAGLDNLFISLLNGIPLLALGNKMDEPGALSKESLTQETGLQSFKDREVCCFMISCKNYTNIDEVFDWLLKHSKSNKFLSLLCCVPR